MQVTAVVFLLVIVGLALIALGIYGVVKERFSQETKGTGPGVSFTLPLSAFVLLMGIGSLAVAGYFALNGSKSSAASPRPSRPSAKPASKRPTASPSSHSGVVAVTRPAFGADVGACGVFSGTADLPPGETLILAAENLSDTTRTMYLQPVNNWSKPGEISDWTGFQYFGSGNSSVGQKFEVSVIAIKTDVVTAALAQPANNPAWAVKSLPAGAKVKEALRVVRVKGPGPVVCH